jgi:LPXTG-site transpeptidase (sortase) family protein
MLLSALLGIIGAGSLVYGLWARGKKPLWANWFMLAGVILFCGGALFGVAAWGFQVVPSERPQQLAAINHATQAPQDIAASPLQPTDFVEVWDAWPTPTPDSLPDYPIPEPPEHLNQGADGNEPDSSAMTRILIPAMGLDTVVKYVPFDSSTWLIGGLKQEVAWMGDTSWPGLGSNTGLAGHVDLANGDSGPFWNLGDLKPGDRVSVFTERSQYTYQVRESRIVPDSDLSVIEPSEKPQLTLITCTGWDAELKLYLLRLVVFADLIEVMPLNETALKP